MCLIVYRTLFLNRNIQDIFSKFQQKWIFRLSVFYFDIVFQLNIPYNTEPNFILLKNIDYILKTLGLNIITMVIWVAKNSNLQRKFAYKKPYGDLILPLRWFRFSNNVCFLYTFTITVDTTQMNLIKILLVDLFCVLIQLLFMANMSMLLKELGMNNFNSTQRS